MINFVIRIRQRSTNTKQNIAETKHLPLAYKTRLLRSEQWRIKSMERMWRITAFPQLPGNIDTKVKIWNRLHYKEEALKVSSGSVAERNTASCFKYCFTHNNSVNVNNTSINKYIYILVYVTPSRSITITKWTTPNRLIVCSWLILL